jgi:predicted 3-demethylubiquinone-9 3-methyltransferase (glyoxalase superfamily)
MEGAAMTAPSISTCLWFDSQAEEAATLYCSLFPDARITLRMPQMADPQGRAFLVEFTLMGQTYVAMNGGPHYKLTPAASIVVNLDTQAQIDHLWDALLDGGQPSRCGWLTDRYGLSWQILPRALPLLLQQDPSGRVMQAMMGMVKLDIAALESALT